MIRLAAALGVGALAGAALFVPVSRTISLPFVALSEEPVRVLFVGDIMLDRNVAATAESQGVPYLFADILELIARADVRVANLEGTVTAHPSIARENNKVFHFTFNPTVAQEALQILHLTAASLANNHSYDFGAEGYASTRGYLSGWGVLPFGHPYNASSSLSAKLTVRGKIICLAGYHALFVSATASLVNEIKTLRSDCWRIIVFAHWGEEYKTAADAQQKAAARAFVDAGADLVVGAHPHVVQQVEVYKGRAIFYSLGNFMFDQNFSWGVTHGLAVRVDFYEDKTNFTVTPLSIVQQHSSIATSTVAEFSLP